MTKKHRQIGVAIIWNSDRSQILIDQRLSDGDFADYWEFPGGKIEAGEDAIACIQREIREELGIGIVVDDHLITIEHEYKNIIVTLHVHHCRHVSGEPQAIECAQVRWVDIAELGQYRFPEANYEIVAAIHQVR